MSNNVVVSFEDDAVRVIYGSLKGKIVAVKDSLTLKQDEFDAFLSREKAKEFIVVNSFKNYYQDTVLIPFTKEKFIRKLLDADLRRKAPFKDFSYIYTIAGEKFVDKIRKREVFVFAVDREEIADIVNRFTLKGKVIKAIYHDLFAIASKIDSGDAPVLCVSENSINKNIFLVKNKQVLFIRSVQSIEKGISDFDIQNINMTVNYCRQTFKIDPSMIMLAGSLCNDYSAATGTAVPVGCFNHRIYQTKQFFDLNCISPLTAFFTMKWDINLLPRNLKLIYRVKLFLKYSTLSMMLLSMLGICYGVYLSADAVSLKNSIASKKSSPADLNGLLALYDVKKNELASYEAFIRSIEGAMAVPDIDRFFAMISNLNVDNVRMDTLAVKASGELLNVTMKGTVRAEGFAEMQKTYQDFIAALPAIKGTTIKTQALDLKNRGFNIEIEWRGTP